MSANVSQALLEASKVWLAMRVEGLTLDRGAALLTGAEPAVKSAAQSYLYCAVRNRLKVLFVEKSLIEKPAPQKVASLLEIALSLLIAGDINEYTVVNEAGKAVREIPDGSYSAGFVNAVLRNFLRKKDVFAQSFSENPTLAYNVPRWWYEKIKTQYPARYKEILTESLAQPALILRVNNRRIKTEDFLKALSGAGIAARFLGAAAVLIEKPVPVEKIPGFGIGLCSVQDAASQLAARLLPVKDRDRVLDACAAPGGKSAAILERSDADVTALDIEPRRCAKIRDNMRRLGLVCDIRCADASNRDFLASLGDFDDILLDAPCTASGIVSRHPDIVFMRRPGDIAGLAAQQKKLLEALWERVRPGGSLLYCVCSIFLEEGPWQIDAFLARHSGAREVKRISLVPSSRDADPGHPAVHDGFFYSLMRKEGL